MFFKRFVAIKIAVFLKVNRLTTESVKSSALPFQGVHHIHSSDGLPLSMLGVCNCIANHILQENLENASSFFVDEPRDTFYSTTSSKTSNGWLRNTLDIIAKNLTMTLGSTFSETFSSFSTSRHFCF